VECDEYTAVDLYAQCDQIPPAVRVAATSVGYRAVGRGQDRRHAGRGKAGADHFARAAPSSPRAPVNENLRFGEEAAPRGDTGARAGAQPSRVADRAVMSTSARRPSELTGTRTFAGGSSHGAKDWMQGKYRRASVRAAPQ